MWQAASWARRSPKSLTGRRTFFSSSAKRVSLRAPLARRGGAAGCARPPGRSRWNRRRWSPRRGRRHRRGGRRWRRRPGGRPSSKTGLKTKMSGRCMPPSKGSFIDEDVAGVDVIAIVAQHRFDRGRHRAEMARQRQPLRDEPPLCVGERGGEIHVVAEHAGIGGAADGERHLVRNGEDGVAKQLEAERIVPARALGLCRARRAALPHDRVHTPPPPLRQDDSEGRSAKSTLAGADTNTETARKERAPVKEKAAQRPPFLFAKSGRCYWPSCRCAPNDPARPLSLWRPWFHT